MSIVPVKDKKSIVPVRDKKRFIILPSGKIKDVDIESVNILTPRSTSDYSNISKTIEELNRQIVLEKERNKDLEGQLEGNTLKQRLDHANIQLKEYRIYCFKSQGDIQVKRCIIMREQNKCLNKCKSIKDFIQKIN